MKYKATLILLLIVHLAFGQDKRVQRIDSLLNSLYSDKEINGSFLIAEKDKIIYNKSFGYANEETKEKLNENSVFELASCSKQFTAMAIMMLKEKGKLNLDDSLSKFIPQLSFYKNITIRNLLNHTSGIPDYTKWMDSLYDNLKIATNKDVISFFAKYKPKVHFAPNDKWEYSNTGYAFLATIIEKVSGLTYAYFLDSAIFKPLKMNNTFIYHRFLSPKKIDNYAVGYWYSDSLSNYILPNILKELRFVIWLDGIVGDGSIHSTVMDLFKWDRALCTTKLVSKESMNEIFSDAILNDKSKTNYGFGWQVDSTTDCGKIVWHDGGWPGYVTYIERQIDNGKTIIMLQNHNDAIIPRKDLVRIIYNQPFSKEKNVINLKTPNNDFETALEIHDSIIGPTNVCKGIGAHLDYAGTGTYYPLKETNSAWYKFTVNKDTVLTFDIVPNHPKDDYDFILFKCPTKDCINKIRTNAVKPDRACFSYNIANLGSTGLSEYYKDVFVLSGPGPAYASGLPVKAGETLYLMVDWPYQFYYSRGYTIYFHNLWPKKPAYLKKTKPIKNPIVLENVLFETDKSILLKESCVTLDKLVNQLLLNKTMKIEIRGHTDNVGDSISNQKLSEERAKAVVDYLISKNIDKSRLSYKGFGSKQPIVSNDTEEGRKENRRVEFIILKN
jgi:CubicO group peptidase (beta-lactamase class C family)/outer membrane protein OmpA-like peptidoglycan-associated protein